MKTNLQPIHPFQNLNAKEIKETKLNPNIFGVLKISVNVRKKTNSN